jgi:endogenous inhibitor of DNA gyrase (YacG/DUF329 family)
MVKVKCKICGKHFFAKQWHIDRGWARFCSISCKNEGQKTGRFIKCAICGKKAWKIPRAFQHSKSGKFFCGKTCQTIWRNKYYSGSKHTRWRNGVASYRKVLRANNKPVACTLCKESDTRVLQAHHRNKNRNDNVLRNLAWLCINCHRLVHLHNQKLPSYARS